MGRLLERPTFYVEEINAPLVRYGKLLYQSGRPYGHYSETINAMVSKKAILRRQLSDVLGLRFFLDEG